MCMCMGMCMCLCMGRTCEKAACVSECCAGGGVGSLRVRWSVVHGTKAAAGTIFFPVLMSGVDARRGQRGLGDYTGTLIRATLRLLAPSPFSFCARQPARAHAHGVM